MMPSPRTTVSAACAVTRSVRSLTSAATFIHLSRVIEAFFRGQILRHWLKKSITIRDVSCAQRSVRVSSFTSLEHSDSSTTKKSPGS